MQSRIFPYEEMQVNRFLHDLYVLWGGKLDEEMCIGEGWIVYMEGREKYTSDISDAEYWGYVRDNVKKRLEELKKIRNERMSLESRLSSWRTERRNRNNNARKNGRFCKWNRTVGLCKAIGNCKI